MENLIEELQDLYKEFYEKLKLDENGYYKNRKFQNHIRIGSNYLNGTPKILIIGLDAGTDHKNYSGIIKPEDGIKIDVKGKVNPHMAGVYGTVLHFQNDKKWDKLKEELDKAETFQKVTKDPDKLRAELLSSFAIVNFYSFVTKNRKAKTGSKDRIFLDEEFEIKHLINLIDTINPDIIVAQSKSLKKYFKGIKQSIKNQSTKIYIGYHPSAFGRNIKYRTPKNYFEKLIEIK